MPQPKQEQMSASAPENAAKQLMPKPQPDQADDDQQKRRYGEEQDRIQEDHCVPPATFVAFRSSLSLRLAGTEPLSDSALASP